MNAAPKKRMRREDRRDVLIAEATKVFGRLGYHNATTAELARAAGVSEALLYQHFGSKQDLLIACIESLGDTMYTGLQALLAEASDPEITFRALYQQLSKFMSARPEILRFSLVILAELEDDAVRKTTRTVVERSVGLLTRALTAGQKRGVLRSDLDPEAIAWLLVGLYQLSGLTQRLGIADRLNAQRFSAVVAAMAGKGPST